MPSQDYTADDSSNGCFECSKMQLFEPMCDRSHCLFLISWKTASKKNGYIPLMVRFRHVQLFRKTGDHLIGRASYASNFCWIQLILKHPYSRLLFTLRPIRVNPRFITCYVVIDVFRSTAIVVLEHFFLLIDASLF